MKFFILTCLLAVALAKHEMKYISSSDESSNISQEKYRQDNYVVFQTSQERTERIDEMISLESSSGSSSEETTDSLTDKIELTKEDKVYLKQLNKNNQFYQELNFPQYLQAYNQHQIVRNPWNPMKTNDYLLFPLLEKEPYSSHEETSKKIVDRGSTEVSPEKVELNEGEKNYLKQLVKINQKFPSPQYFQAVHPQQIAVNPWNRIKENTYPFLFTLRNF